jgi:Cu-Zn family superoxide dismutase
MRSSTLRRSTAVAAVAVAAFGLSACTPPGQESSDQKGTTPAVFTSQEPPAGYEAGHGGHGTPDEGGHVTETEAEFVNRDGDEIGTVTFVQMDQGIEITLDVEDLTPGVHGWHVHVNPTCEGDFTSAGGHLMRDGVDVGAFQNLQVNQDGTAKISFTTDQFTWEELENDGKGRAVVIHNGTDPANRAACAILK